MIELSPQFEKAIKSVAESAVMQAKLKGFVPKQGGKQFTSDEALDDSKDLPTSLHNSMFSFEGFGLSEQLLYYVEKAYPEYTVNVSGHFYYPTNGFMGWHTNSDVPCKHLYITVALGEGLSFFKYRDNSGVIVTDYDNEGINFREFDTTAVEPLFWHCVYSERDRVSFGYRLLKSDT